MLLNFHPNIIRKVAYYHNFIDTQKVVFIEHLVCAEHNAKHLTSYQSFLQFYEKRFSCQSHFLVKEIEAQRISLPHTPLISPRHHSSG